MKNARFDKKSLKTNAEKNSVTWVDHALTDTVPDLPNKVRLLILKILKSVCKTPFSI